MAIDEIIESRQEEYSLENISRLMSQEEHGLHISLIDTGDIKNGKNVYGIQVETDLGINTVEEILIGLLNQINQVKEGQ